MAEDEQEYPKSVHSREFEIRQIAMAEIMTKSTGIAARRYFVELNHIKRRPLSVEWLEAIIMICVIRRSRPARVMGFLKKLREKRQSQGNIADFMAFYETINAYLAPESLTNHGYGMAVFSGKEHSAIWDHVGTHLAFLKDEGYEAFLNSGTLLGVVRDKKLIDHDDDIDLGLILKATNEKDAAKEWLEVQQRLIDADVYDAAHVTNDAILKLPPIDGVQIDLFPAWQSDGKFYVYPHTYADLDVADVLPLKPCDVTGHQIPAEPEKMLAINYTPGWKVPDPIFKFPWDEANEKFATFLQEIET